MKKITSIFGLSLVALITCCGGIKSEAKKTAELACKYNRMKKQNRLHPTEKGSEELNLIREEMILLSDELESKPEILDHRNEFEAEVKRMISETADCSCELSDAEMVELEKEAKRAQDSVANLMSSPY